MSTIETPVSEQDRIVEVKGIRWVLLSAMTEPRREVTMACCEFGHIRVTKSELTNECIITRADIVKAEGFSTFQEAMEAAAPIVKETAEAKILHAEVRLTEAKEAARAVGVKVE